jgi:hypothetical protein
MIKEKNICVDDIAGIVIDRKNKKRFVFMDNMIINQIERDGPKTVKQILKDYKKEFEIVSKKIAVVQTYICSGLVDDKLVKNELFTSINALMCNVNNSITSMCLLICHGFKLQPMIISRNIIENVSMIAHLCTYPLDLERFKNDSIKSTRTIGTLKKIIPTIGAIYGSYSSNFVHISSHYNNIEIVKAPEQNDSDFKIVLSSLYICVWIYSVVAELVAIDIIGIDNVPNWARRDKDSYYFNLSPETVDEMKLFIKDLPEKKKT